MNKKSIVAGIIISAALALPFAASALSVDDIQQQIRDLLSRVSALQEQLRVQTQASSSPAQIAPGYPRYCALINRSLSRGQSGEDVRALQEFLSGAGFLNASATGYFGPATAGAVAQWQSSEGVQPLGVFGPLSLARLKIRCGNGWGATLSADPASGAAPLNVTFTTQIGINDALPSIDFGDGTSGATAKGSCIAITAIVGGQGGIRCSATASHTYTQNGTYTAQLLSGGIATAKTSVQVGDAVSTNGGTLAADPNVGSAPLSVSFTFQPKTDDSGQGKYWIDFGDGNGQIMDLHQIYCFRAPCISPSVATHTYSNPGSYTAVVTTYIGCQHTNPRCLIATVPLAQATVSVIGSSSAGAPSISQFSGPTTLGVNEIGTWQITASDPANGTLSYSVIWGDEWPAGASASNKSLAPQASIQQNTSFTHSYSNPGTYNVAITVTNASGKQARSTATVQVSQNNLCTAEYAPVCGRPAGCTNTCAAGQVCPAICQLPPVQTYSNRCQMNNSNATYLHDGACQGNELY